MEESNRSVSQQATELRNGRGDLIGGIASVAIPGVMAGPLKYEITYIGWAHDWDADNPNGDYIPICLGHNQDREDLLDEIELRARDAQCSEAGA